MSDTTKPKRCETLVPAPDGTQWRIERYDYPWLILLPEGDWDHAAIPNFFYKRGDRNVSTVPLADGALYSPQLARAVSKRLAREGRKILAAKRAKDLADMQRDQAWTRLKEGLR